MFLFIIANHDHTFERPFLHEMMRCLSQIHLCNLPFFCPFRTIMNSNLKSIQSRAFAQNPHLRYM